MFSKEKIKHIRKLHDKKGRIESGLFLVEGRKIILELLASEWKNQIEELYVSEKLFEELVVASHLVGENGERCCVELGENISKISTLENNSDGIAVVKQRDISHETPLSNFPLPGERANCKSASHLSWKERIEGGVVCDWTLVLDSIRDPGNIGTILRTAAWFGVKRIICSQDCVEIYNPKVVSATMGALFHLDISYMNLEDFYEKNILPVYAAELGGKNIGEISFPKMGILVMGSESHGISEISRKYMTQGILIPKIGYGESLNVGIATGILLSHIVK